MAKSRDPLSSLVNRLDAVDRLIKIKEEKIEGIQVRLDYELLDLTALRSERQHINETVNFQMFCNNLLRYTKT